MSPRPVRRAVGQTWLIVVAALAGLALAVALAVLTSHLTTQHVGLAGEPSRPAPGLVVTTTTPSTPSAEHEQKDD